MASRKEFVPYWTCKELGGCFAIAVTCTLNKATRLEHTGFYALSKFQMNAAQTNIQRRMLLKDAIASLRKYLNHAIAKEKEARKCTT